MLIYVLTLCFSVAGCSVAGCCISISRLLILTLSFSVAGCSVAGCCISIFWFSTSLLHILLHIRISMWPESSNVYRYWVLTGELRNDVEWPETSATYHWYQISGRMESGSEWPLNQRNFWGWFNANKKDCIICTEERVPVRVCYTVRKRQNVEEWMPVCVRCKKTL